MARVLIVEDDPQVSAWVARLVEEEGHVVDVADRMAAADRLAAATPYGLAIVDLELPDRSGIALVHALRRAGQTLPIIILTGRAEDEVVVAGLDAGADDYLVKPVSDRVLRARVRAVLRRRDAGSRNELVLGPIALDPRTRQLRTPSGPVALSTQEYALLELFLQRPGEVIPRSTLLAHVWGVRFEPGTNRVDVAVSRVRQKLAAIEGAPQLRAVRGAGYRLAAPSLP
ncbi:MAG TPA: response regulator transcription factor [Gemmatimonadaceae bacterium]|jgi:DNA-binding response OmpR family regulator